MQQMISFIFFYPHILERQIEMTLQLTNIPTLLFDLKSSVIVFIVGYILIDHIVFCTNSTWLV